jgi:ketosteroid isomerase-like protein
MNGLTTRARANDPQDLERLLVARENAGDIAGMTALFEPDAVVEIGDGTFLRGREAIHEFFTKLQVTGFGPEKRKFEFGEQRPALICGDLALTSTRSRDGTVTSEVARRQKDGTWLWVIDRYSVSWWWAGMPSREGLFSAIARAVGLSTTDKSRYRTSEVKLHFSGNGR